jgi:5-deoxy-5-amino-3-dehydroquinate synthase
MKRVTVRVDPPYDVVVGRGALREIGPLLADRRRVAVVSQAAIADAYAGRACADLPNAEVFLIDDGEPAKTLATVERVGRDLAAWGLLRDDVIVALGGGVVGDVAGFTAAVYHRGVAVLQVPTTLLAQIDAAIGGKTGVNLPEGKNLIGAFHQPAAVIADVDTLQSLPEREYRAGLAEVAKYAFLPEGERLAKSLVDGVAQVRGRDPDVLTEVVTESARIKAIHIEDDPEERTGRRAALNYGHTLAHALEALGGYDILHGEAVAIGLVFADALAVDLGRVPSEALERHRDVLVGLGLPTRVEPGRALTRDVCVAQMHRDKKARGGLTFVLPSRNGLERVDDPPAPALDRAFAAIGVES